MENILASTAGIGDLSLGKRRCANIFAQTNRYLGICDFHSSCAQDLRPAVDLGQAQMRALGQRAGGLTG